MKTNLYGFFRVKLICNLIYHPIQVSDSLSNKSINHNNLTIIQKNTKVSFKYLFNQQQKKHKVY